MPYPRATLTQRIAQAVQDLASARIMDTTTGAAVDATLLSAASSLRALATMVAGAAYEEDGYIDWLALQATPWNATGEWAVAWGGLVGVAPKPSAYATGSRAVTGGPANGAIASGTQLSRLDGTIYLVLSDVTLDGSGAGTLPLIAQQPGAAGNAPTGTALTPTLTIAGLVVSSAGALTGGVDAEAEAAFKARYLQRYAAPPQGGALADYLAWTLAVPGVTRAWVNPRGGGAGSVVVYPMFDAAEAAHAGFPQGSDGVASQETRAVAATGDQLAVANALYPLRPVTALVIVCAPIAYPVAFVIHPTSPVPAATQALVPGAIDAVFLTKASPLGTPIETDVFVTAIAAVPGMPDFTLAAPALTIQALLGHLPMRGAVTYA